VSDFTTETTSVFVEVDAHRDALLAELDRRGVGASPVSGGIHIEGGDDSVYDHIRDAAVAADAPLRRMAPRRRALAELFAREGDENRGTISEAAP